MLLFCMQAGARIVAVSVAVSVFVSVFVSVSVEESFPQDTMLCFLLFAGIIFNTRATGMRGVGESLERGSIVYMV